MEQVQDFSLIDQLGLKNTLELVAQQQGKVVYAHTIYYELDDIDYEKYITETDEPVDNIFSEIQQRFCIDMLQNDKVNWTHRNFMTASNVGIYYDKNILSPVVPDMFLSFDVPQIDNWFEKKHKAYFTWVMGKPPELVLEIVSNKVGGEDTTKVAIYAKMGVKYYIIQDPYLYLSTNKIRLFVLDAQGVYQEHIAESESDFYYMPEVNLGMVLWRGIYEDREAEWMRWCNKVGNMLLTSKEIIAKEVQAKEQERMEKEQERERAEREFERAEQERLEKEQERLEKEQERERAERERMEKEQERERAERERMEKEQERVEKERERKRAEREFERAEQERIEKEREKERVEKLLAKLMALGLRPEEVEGL